jgi:excisionase family DNA binding protein
MKTKRLDQKLAYTVEESAQLLSLSRSTMYDLIATEQIVSFKVGRARRISQQALFDFLSSNSGCAQTPDVPR